MAEKATELLASRKNELSVVAQDRNWRSYVANELMCQDQWNQDWGFLAGTQQDSSKKLAATKTEKISALEEQIRASKAKSFTTTNGMYGTKEYRSLELFDNTGNNIIKAADLMPCPRRPPKK